LKILVLNSGSSSLKYQFIDVIKEEAIVEGICERIGIEGSVMTYKVPGKELKKVIEQDMPSHKEAISLVLDTLQDKEIGVISSAEDVDGIGHRVVHGGELFEKSVLVDERVIKELKSISALAPLHNPANILGIEICQELLKGKPNVAVFDTAFHQTMPEKAFMYPLPYQDYEELRVRKYGFHGTSHKFVSEQVREILGKDDAKVIVCHLGNGASVSAVHGDKCLDTSMGLTPLQGLMMGTRCGDIDPAAVLHIMKERGLTVKEMDNRLNKESGLLGIYGKSSDSRDIENGVAEGDKRAILAEDMFAYRVKSYIGAYAAVLGGVDAIAFTAGIGENAASMREKIASGLEYLGVEFDTEVNSVRKSGIVELSKKDSKVKVFKVPTNEELVIARDTYQIIK
jgi:acetate kinase